MMRCSPARVLVVCQEGLERELRGRLPHNVEIRHFNDITGENAYSKVALVIMIGRTEPSPRTVEQITRALFGRDVVEVEPDEKGEIHHPRVARGIRMRDSTGRAVEGSQHPDPRVEAVRWSICEANGVQSIGRGRGVNRGPLNPLQIDILTNVCLPIEVDEVTTWEAIQPGPVEIMRARGVVPFGYADMAAMHGDLFRTGEAARKALDRKNPGQMPIERFLLGDCPGFSGIAHYRKAGGRGPPGRAWIDLARADIAARKAELEAKLGPLAQFAVEIMRPPDVAEAAPEAEQVAVRPPDAVAGPELLPSEVRNYAGGVMSPSVIAWTRERRRAAGMSQDEMARRIGLSRPQLANAEAQRFGLSQTAAARLLAECARLRPRQIEPDLPLLAAVRHARRRPRAEEARHAAD